jgi:hypothetical protein
MTLRSWAWTKWCDGVDKLRVAYIPTKTLGTYAPRAEKFGPFEDSTSRRPAYIYIYNDPGH